jgi:long-chain acyl-CoA synthetase
MDDLQVLKPHIFASVPRLYTKIYDRIMAGVQQKSAMQQWLFDRALASKLYYLETQGSLHHKFYDNVVFKRIRNLLGGEIKLMITGSAPISG